MSSRLIYRPLEAEPAEGKAGKYKLEQDLQKTRDLAIGKKFSRTYFFKKREKKKQTNKQTNAESSLALVPPSPGI